MPLPKHKIDPLVTWGYTAIRLSLSPSGGHAPERRGQLADANCISHARTPVVSFGPTFEALSVWRHLFTQSPG